MPEKMLDRVQIEIEQILLGERRQRKISRAEARGVEANAKHNLDFLNDLANKQPFAAFLDKGGLIVVIPDFIRSDSDKMINSSLYLAKVKDVRALYFFKNVEFPVNRTDDDCIPVTMEELSSWPKPSFEKFGKATETKLLRSMLRWLRNYRLHI
jgi:hypothetical protein